METTPTDQDHIAHCRDLLARLRPEDARSVLHVIKLAEGRTAEADYQAQRALEFARRTANTAIMALGALDSYIAGDPDWEGNGPQRGHKVLAQPSKVKSLPRGKREPTVFSYYLLHQAFRSAVPPKAASRSSHTRKKGAA